MSTPPSKSGLVLIVDDNDSVRAVLEAGLEEQFEVVTAANAILARKVLSSREFDVVLTDYEMPGETGGALLAHLEATSPFTVGILMTGYSGSSDVKSLVDKSLDNGRILVLYKPVELDDILAWVKNGVAMARLARAKSRVKASESSQRGTNAPR